MELNELLGIFDKAAANLAKLEAVWDRASVLIPNGPAAGSNPEYDNLCRAWSDLLAGLPAIDGFRLGSALPDIDALGRAFIDYAEVGQIAHECYEEAERPGRELADYRYRLDRARREATRGRLAELRQQVSVDLDRVLDGVPRDSTVVLDDALIIQIGEQIAEIERLIGDVVRTGRWADLARHRRFGEGHDWHDIRELDWPSLQNDLDAAQVADSDPLQVPDVDLGVAAREVRPGVVTTALQWRELDDNDFERMLYDLLRSFESHKNVQWLMKTRATDRGRDLSMDRITTDETGITRTIRVIVQAKHWLSKSVAASDVLGTVAGMTSWEPPAVRELLIVTSGAFTSDAVAWIDDHNARGRMPLIEMWPGIKLESLLSQRASIAVSYGLR